MPLGMALKEAGDSTNGTTVLATAYFGSFGNTNAESPCKAHCASGLGRAATSDTSTEKCPNDDMKTLSSGLLVSANIGLPMFR